MSATAPPMPQRRRLLAAAAGAALLPQVSLSLAGQAATAHAPRLALVILRGGLDGLSAVPVPGDAGFSAARGPLAQVTADGSAPLPLVDGFALHPALSQLHGLFTRGQAGVLHAVGLPYQERSHFDAQQMLESGGQRPWDIGNGWLGRALAELPSVPTSGARGMALQAAVPLVLRGPAVVDTWLPAQRGDPPPEALADLAQRVAQLYAADTPLATAFERTRQLHQPGMAMASATPGMAGASPLPGNQARMALLGGQAAGFLARADGPQAVVLEMGGWDTHANQTATLANQLAALDALLGALHQGLDTASLPRTGDASAWQRTLVLVVTEFGRTVAPNGTQGTDHGSGAAAFVLGGAVRGGRVLTDWPGLTPRERTDGRDLRITTDVRALFKTALHQHLGLPLAAVHTRALPGSEALPLLPLLHG